MTKQQTATPYNPITQGVIWKQLLTYFFPILFGTFFQQLYNTVDAVVVGQFVGKEALAAVGGGTSNLLSIIVNLFVGMAVGTTVVVAQSIGSGDNEKLSRTVHASVAMSFVGGLLFTFVGLGLTRPALAAMGTPADIMEHAVTVLHMYCLGMIPSFLYNVGTGILRAMGDTKRPLYFLMVACGVNVVLDLLFVVVFHMGVAGAGIATVLSQWVSAILVYASLCRNSGPAHLDWRKIRLDLRCLWPVLVVGLPAGIQSNMYSISNVVLQGCVNSFGTDTVAALTSFTKVDGFYWMVIGAYGVAITTFAGQNFGAGLYSRVRQSVRSCLLLSSVTTILLSVSMLALARPLLSMFGSDPVVLELAQNMCNRMMPYYITYVCVEVMSGAIRGCGQALIPMIITGCGICGLRVLWVFLIMPLSNHMNTLLLSYPISWSITSICFVLYYFVGKWLPKQDTVQPEIQTTVH